MDRKRVLVGIWRVSYSSAHADDVGFHRAGHFKKIKKARAYIFLGAECGGDHLPTRNKS